MTKIPSVIVFACSLYLQSFSCTRVSRARSQVLDKLSIPLKNYPVPKSLALVPLLLCAFLAAMTAKTVAEETATNSIAMKAAPQPKATKEDPSAKQASSAPVRKLSGAELYSMHCNRCHPERYPTERTAAQWKTILLHMRVRANLPAAHARTILKYLQENSGR